MKKIDITTDQWIEIHKILREKMPVHHIPALKEIFEIHKNEAMIQKMNAMKESIQNNKNEPDLEWIETNWKNKNV